MSKHAESYRAYYWPEGKRKHVDYVLSKRTPSNMRAGDCWCHEHCYKDRTGRRVFPKDYETLNLVNRRNHFWIGTRRTRKKLGRKHPLQARLVPRDGCIVSNRVGELKEDSGSNDYYDQFYSDLKAELWGSGEMWGNLDRYSIHEIEFPKKRQRDASDLIIRHTSGRDCTHVVIVNMSRHRTRPAHLYTNGRTEFNTILIDIRQWTEENILDFRHHGKEMFDEQWDKLNSRINQYNEGIAEDKRRADEIREKAREEARQLELQGYWERLRILDIDDDVLDRLTDDDLERMFHDKLTEIEAAERAAAKEAAADAEKRRIEAAEAAAAAAAAKKKKAAKRAAEEKEKTRILNQRSALTNKARRLYNRALGPGIVSLRGKDPLSHAEKFDLPRENLKLCEQLFRASPLRLRSWWNQEFSASSIWTFESPEELETITNAAGKELEEIIISHEKALEEEQAQMERDRQNLISARNRARKEKDEFSDYISRIQDEIRKIRANETTYSNHRSSLGAIKSLALKTIRVAGEALEEIEYEERESETHTPKFLELNKQRLESHKNEIGVVQEKAELILSACRTGQAVEQDNLLGEEIKTAVDDCKSSSVAVDVLADGYWMEEIPDRESDLKRKEAALKRHDSLASRIEDMRESWVNQLGDSLGGVKRGCDDDITNLRSLLEEAIRFIDPRKEGEIVTLIDFGGPNQPRRGFIRITRIGEDYHFYESDCEDFDSLSKGCQVKFMPGIKKKSGAKPPATRVRHYRCPSHPDLERPKGRPHVQIPYQPKKKETKPKEKANLGQVLSDIPNNPPKDQQRRRKRKKGMRLGTTRAGPRKGKGKGD